MVIRKRFKLLNSFRISYRGKHDIWIIWQFGGGERPGCGEKEMTRGEMEMASKGGGDGAERVCDGAEGRWDGAEGRRLISGLKDEVRDGFRGCGTGYRELLI